MTKIEEIRARMSVIADPKHQSYAQHPLADILIMIMCEVLSGLDTLGDLSLYAKNKEEFLAKKRADPPAQRLTYMLKSKAVSQKRTFFLPAAMV